MTARGVGIRLAIALVLATFVLQRTQGDYLLLGAGALAGLLVQELLSAAAAWLEAHQTPATKRERRIAADVQRAVETRLEGDRQAAAHARGSAT
ncbi:MAG: hypothetical protein KF709_02765 [Gemmatimonadaceae bacterium]|nr:hypothetical protein [Gemmatimonadaceae bacterium]